MDLRSEVRRVRYQLAADDSRLTFAARSSVHPIVVEVAEVRGHLDAEVDGEAIVVAPGARLEVDLAEIRSGNLLIDRETRRRLDLRRHPTLVAELSEARSIGAGVLACRGQVAFQGRTRPVTGELHVRQGHDGALHLEGRRAVDVRRWGLEPPRLLVLRVEPEVTVHLRLLARPLDGSG